MLIQCNHQLSCNIDIICVNHNSKVTNNSTNQHLKVPQWPILTNSQK